MKRHNKHSQRPASRHSRHHEVVQTDYVIAPTEAEVEIRHELQSVAQKMHLPALSAEILAAYLVSPEAAQGASADFRNDALGMVCKFGPRVDHAQVADAMGITAGDNAIRHNLPVMQLMNAMARYGLIGFTSKEIGLQDKYAQLSLEVLGKIDPELMRVGQQLQCGGLSK